MIPPKSFKNIKKRLKKIFSPSQTTKSISSLIKEYNVWLRRTVRYFGLNKALRSQLTTIDYFGFLYFWRLLLRKFGSKKRVRTYIRAKVYSSDYRVCDKEKDGKEQLKLKDILPYGNLTRDNFSFIETFVKSNIYLNKK